MEDHCEDVHRDSNYEGDVDGPEILSGSEEVHASVGGPAPAPAPAPVPDPRPANIFLMPEGLAVTGLQHVVDNLNHDVHKALQHWDNIYGQLKQFEHLLRNGDSRRIFCWTCLHARAPESVNAKFKLFKASLYEARWYDVLRFLKKLPSLLQSLCIYLGPGEV